MDTGTAHKDILPSLSSERLTKYYWRNAYMCFHLFFLRKHKDSPSNNREIAWVIIV